MHTGSAEQIVGAKLNFFDLGYRTRAPIRRDREKVEYLDSKRQESYEGVCLLLHLTSVNTKDIENNIDLKNPHRLWIL